MIKIAGYVMVAFGLMMMAGAGGDCDGKCGPGNSIAEMLTIASIGLAMFGTGFFLLTQKD